MPDAAQAPATPAEQATPQADTPPPRKPRGRGKTTGRFASRADLCERVWFYYLKTDLCVAEIARSTQVSTAVVENIMKTKELRPTEPAA